MFSLKYIIILPLFLFIGCYKDVRDKKSELKFNLKKLELFTLEKNSNYIRNSEGSFVNIENEIYFFYSCFEGERDYDKSNICYIKSKDDGTSWTSPIEIFTAGDNYNLMSVSVSKTEDGIRVFYLKKNRENISDLEWVNYIQDTKIMYVELDKNLHLIKSEEIVTEDEIAFHVMNNDRILQHNDRIFIPYATHKWEGNLKKFLHAKIQLKYTDINMTNIKTANTSNIYKFKNDYIMQEPGIINIERNTYMLYFRTNQKTQYYSLSYDKGENWTEPLPMNISAPQSPASIVKLSNGKLLMVYNKLEDKLDYLNDRNILVVSSSTDGINWKGELELEYSDDGFYCYTAVFESKEFILLAYTSGDSKIGNFNRLKIVRLDIK